MTRGLSFTLFQLSYSSPLDRLVRRAVIKLRNLWPNPLLPWFYML